MNEALVSHGRGKAVGVRCGTGVRAVGAQAPEGHLGRLDAEAGIMRGNQTRCVPDRAVDIDDETAGPTDEVVMVVPDSPLIPGHRARRLDAAQQPDLGESVERVVDGLMRDRRQRPADGADDGLGVRVRMIPHGLEHGNPLFRHTQRGLPQGCGRILCMSMIRPVHTLRMPASFESVKERAMTSAEAAPGVGAAKFAQVIAEVESAADREGGRVFGRACG